ncbi:MAG: LamG-like jellyroll fold domain-containing protein, partial [Planctomycetota bacterium]
PAGVHNGAASFADAGFVDLDGGNFPLDDIPTSAITLAAWVKCEDTGDHHAIFDARTHAGSWLIHPELRADGQFRWALRASGMSPIFDMQAGSVTWGQWLHYAATYDSESGRAVLYVDGQVISQLDLPTGREVPGDWRDGARVGLSIGNARPFTGLMDEFYLFDRALSQSELKQVMHGEGWPHAFGPSPADGATHQRTSVRLDWSAGESAVSHDVYLGESFDDVNGGAETTFGGNQTSTSFVAGLSGFAYPQGLVPGTTYHWRVDEIEANGTVHAGDIWSFRVPPTTAYDPIPADGAKFLETNVELGWTAGLNSKLHTVYFGDNFDEVSSAAGERMQPATTYDPGQLESGKTYYWRVDEFGAAGLQKGQVWSFTTAGAGGGLRGDYYTGVDLQDHVLSRTDPQINFNWGLSGPDEEVGDDNYSIRWTGDLDVPISETYSFYPKVQGGMRLWVDDQLTTDKWQDRGIDERWQDHFPVEHHKAVYLEAGIRSIVMEFAYRQSFGGGAVVVMFWGSPSMPRQIIPQAAFSLPVRANRPSPSSGAVDIRQTTTVDWNPGQHAASHQVYFGVDEEAVRNATAGSAEYRGRQPLGSESYDPGLLEWNTTYYWRVDEINDLNPESPWAGSVWSFTTADFLIVDDFEDYNDYPPDEIYSTWADGYLDPTNGATVGYLLPNWDAGEHYVETSIVHGGYQSMPLFYDNTSTATYSEAERAFAVAQDWTQDGVETLVLYFHGAAENSGQLYVKINGSKVIYDNRQTADDVQQRRWEKWSIALASLPVNPQNITTLSIGIDGAGARGTLYFDDIRLYRPVP